MVRELLWYTKTVLDNIKNPAMEVDMFRVNEFIDKKKDKAI